MYKLIFTISFSSTLQNYTNIFHKGESQLVVIFAFEFNLYNHFELYFSYFIYLLLLTL